MRKKVESLVQFNVEPLIRIVQNNDTNYVVGFIVALLAAKTLQLKQEDKFYYDKMDKVQILSINLLFLVSVIIIASYNMVLGMILAILFISINI